MRARTLLLLLVAVLLAGGTAFLARSWLATQKNQEEIRAASLPLQKPSRSVLVAKADLKRGQILRPEDSVWQIWPEGALDKTYIVLGGPPVPPRTPESFAGWVVRNPIASGEPITEGKIIAPGNKGFLAAVLRPGMRAISVPVTITSDISGFIFPGDEVDLLLTYGIPTAETAAGPNKPGYEHKVAETMMRDIRVIAIDQRLESKPGEAVPAHTATFEVTPKQSEVITLASEIGRVSFTLRSLVPGLHEKPASEQTIAESAGANSPDSSIGATATYTVDSEISPLLPKFSSGKAGSEPDTESAGVTILRGGGNASQSVASAPTAKGS